ncbi:MAG: UDP-N-acetylmuramate dehydrogenase [Bacteroidia bacterium]|jgi:UDP-N-acetylmuramate dehydrogenase
MKLERNKDLSTYNTFGLPVVAQSFVEVNNVQDVQSLIQKGTFQKPFFILGGGSNILFTKNFEGVVVKNNIKGINILEEDSKTIIISIGAGENWHDTVMYAVEHNWGGIENLSLIPGCVGAAPIQNIGAYGVEIKDVLERVHFVDLETGAVKFLEKKQCQFGYRNSIFKHTLKNKVIITSIEIGLSKSHALKLDYGAIKDQLALQQADNVTIRDVSNAVITIRKTKLPDPAELGNSGSFFKNPIIPKTVFERIKETHPMVKSYPIDKKHVKIAAGWLIEQCGWKGKRVGNTGSHAKQALVLVNYGDAKGSEILELAESIILSVKQTFNVVLEPEVNIL